MMDKHSGFKSTCLLLGAAFLILFCLTEQSIGQVTRLNEQIAQLYNQGRYKEAIFPAKRALAIREKTLGPEHPYVAASLNNLAELYRRLGNYTKAETLSKRALAIWEKVRGPEHPNVATSLNNLTLIYMSLGNYAQAESLSKRALAIWEKVRGPEHPNVTTSLNNLAKIYISLGNYTKAEPLLKSALSIREKTLGSQHPKVGIILNNLAALYYFLGKYAQAEPLFKRSLAIREKMLGSEHPDVGGSLNNLAELYRSLGNYTQAELFYKRALTIYEKTVGPEHPYVAKSLNSLALLFSSLGNYTQAKLLHNRALSIYEKTVGPEHLHFATTLNNLASLHYSFGNYTLVEPLLKRALAIYEKTVGPEHPNFARSLNDLALLYSSLGNYTQVESLYKRILTIYEKTVGPEHPNFAIIYSNLATHYSSLGNYTQAEQLYKRVLMIYEKTVGPEHPDFAKFFSMSASIYSSLGNYTQAEQLYKRALTICEKTVGPEHPDFATILNKLAFLYLMDGRIDKAFNIFNKHDSPDGLGACYLKRGEYRKAEEKFQKILKYSEKTSQKKFVITAHIGLGFAYEGIKNFTDARKHFRNAIDLIEAQWQTLELSAKRAFLSGNVEVNFTRLDAYEGMVRVVIREKKRGYQKESLLYAEKVKSRTLLEILTAKNTKGIEKNNREIFAKDRRFQQEIDMLKKRMSVLTELGLKAPEREKQRAEQMLNTTLRNYEQFINEVKLQNTELASLITVAPLSAEKIQSLLDSSVTILEYFTTKDDIFVWTITKNEIRVHELSIGNKTIHTMVNDLLLPNISDTSRRPAPLILLSTGETQDKKTDKQEKEKNRKRFLNAARNFYRSIIKPVENEIHTENLIIVPHGALHKVPFAALNDGKQYMADKYAISVVPSSAVIEYVVKKRNRNKGRLLAFANPVTDYVSLGFAETEINNISGIFPEKETYFRSKATESRAKGKSASPDIIHFACHGEFNDKQPMQSGLLLSKDMDNDGRLQVHELFGLNLRNANLVVLSACDTALSRIYGGDDLVGLARGFIYAGTPSILATLWEVDDRSTSILMKKFYENWYRKGMSKPEALRKAQISIKSMPGYEHPFYWAPFVMIGDWK